MYVVFLKKNPPYGDVMMAGRTRVAFETELRSDGCDANKLAVTEANTFFQVETEAAANALAEHLAIAHPGKEVLVSNVQHIFQTEKPAAAKKKTVSEKGVLPA
mgnify:CR=1 FL=1